MTVAIIRRNNFRCCSSTLYAIFSGSMLRSLFGNCNLFAARSIGLFNAGDFQHRYQEPSNDESFRHKGQSWGQLTRACSFGDVLIFLGRFIYQNIDPIHPAQSTLYLWPNCRSERSGHSG
jgi:hypothetical protein